MVWLNADCHIITLRDRACDALCRQITLTSKFDKRKDDSVLQNYGGVCPHLCGNAIVIHFVVGMVAALMLKMAEVVPDGIVGFFPSYSYMTYIISKWHSSGVLAKIQVRVDDWCCCRC